MNPPEVLVYEDNPDAALAQAAAALKSGLCVVYPTDTVYGLLAHPCSSGAYHQIYRLKARPVDQPLALLVHPGNPAASAVEAALAGESELCANYLAGSLTVVIDEPHVPGIPSDVHEIQPGPLGLRRPVDRRTGDLLEACGGLLWATSVNASGEPPAVAADQVRFWLEGINVTQRPLAVTATTPLSGTASSVVRLTAAGPEFLR